MGSVHYTLHEGLHHLENKIEYHIAGKLGGGRKVFGEFGEWSAIRQTKTIQISTYNKSSIG